MAVIMKNGEYRESGDANRISYTSDANKIDLSYYKIGGEVVRGDTYNSSYKYMRRAFDYYKQSGNLIDVSRRGYRPGTPQLFYFGAGYVTILVNSDGSKTINGSELSTAKGTSGFKDVFYILLAGGGGSGKVGGSTTSGGGGGGAASVHFIIDFSKAPNVTEVNFQIASGGAGQTSKGSNGNDGGTSAFYYWIPDGQDLYFTCGGGAKGTDQTGGAGGTVTAGSRLGWATGDALVPYYLSISGGRGGNADASGGGVSWTAQQWRPEAGLSISRSGGGSPDGRGGGGGASAFGNGTDGRNYKYSTGAGSYGSGSGGVGWSLTSVDGDSGKGGDGCLYIWY